MHHQKTSDLLEVIYQITREVKESRGKSSKASQTMGHQFGVSHKFQTLPFKDVFAKPGYCYSNHHDKLTGLTK